MTGVILIFGLALVALALLDWFPPTSLIIKPLIQVFFKLSGGIISGVWRYLVIFVKALVADHANIVRHLGKKRIDLDAKERMEFENAKRR